MKFPNPENRAIKTGYAYP